jgi:DNA-binding GntR family transcriptional regulator
LVLHVTAPGEKITCVAARTRTSEAVAAYVLSLLFEGTLRGGDRIDLDGLAKACAVSRVGVRNGLRHLERDGLVRVLHHRGAFVAKFDAVTIREAFNLYGLLSAVTFRRAAAKASAELLEHLATLDETLASCTDVDEFEQVSREFRRAVIVAAAGPHLRALLGTFSVLVPAASRLSIVDAMAEERSALSAEFEALRAGDPVAAAAAALDHAALTADNAIRALRQRGVVPGDHNDLDDRAAHLDLVRRIDDRGLLSSDH